MTVTVASTFGTFTEEELKKLDKGLSELSDVMTMKEAQNETMKEIVKALNKELNIPKSLIRELAKTHHKSNYSEVVAQQEEFQLLYEGIRSNSNSN